MKTFMTGIVLFGVLITSACYKQAIPQASGNLNIGTSVNRIELVKVVEEFAKQNKFDSKVLEPSNEEYLESKSRFSKTYYSQDQSFIGVGNVIDPACLSIAVYMSTNDAGKAAELRDNLLSTLRSRFSSSVDDQAKCGQEK